MFLKTAYCPRTAKIRYLLWSHLLSHLIAELFIVLFSGRDKENPSKADGRMKHVTSSPHVVWKNERGRPVTKKIATQCGGKHLRKEETLADSILTTPSTIKRVWVTSAKQLSLPSFVKGSFRNQDIRLNSSKMVKRRNTNLRWIILVSSCLMQKPSFYGIFWLSSHYLL